MCIKTRLFVPRQHYSELPAMMLSSSAKKSTSDTDSDEVSEDLTSHDLFIF